MLQSNLYLIIRIMTNVCTGNLDQLEILVSNNYLSHTKEALMDNIENKVTVKNLIWGICNFSGSSFKARDYMITSNMLDDVLRIQDRFKKDEDIEAKCLWFYSNLMRGTPFPSLDIADKIISVVKQTLLRNEHSDEIDYEAVWCLSLYVEPNIDKQQRIQKVTMKDEKVVRKMISMLSSPLPNILTAVTRYFGNITSDDSEVADWLVTEMGLLDVERRLTRNWRVF